MAGWDQEVACTAHNVTPSDPEALSLSLLLDGEDLEGLQVLGREVETEPQDDLLFRVTESWQLPPLGTPAPPTLHCQATMRLPSLELSHQRPIPGEPVESLPPRTSVSPRKLAKSQSPAPKSLDDRGPPALPKPWSCPLDCCVPICTVTEPPAGGKMTCEL